MIDEPEASGPSAGVAGLIGVAVAVLSLAGVALAVRAEVNQATERLLAPVAERPKVAKADHAEVAYCTPRFPICLQIDAYSCRFIESFPRSAGKKLI